MVFTRILFDTLSDFIHNRDWKWFTLPLIRNRLHTTRYAAGLFYFLFIGLRGNKRVPERKALVFHAFYAD